MGDMYPRINSLIAATVLLGSQLEAWDWTALSQWWNPSDPVVNEIPPIEIDIQKPVLITPLSQVPQPRGTVLWVLPGGGNWDSLASWGGPIPNGVNAEAEFISVPNTVPCTITASASQTFTIGALQLGFNSAHGAVTFNSNISLKFQSTLGVNLLYDISSVSQVLIQSNMDIVSPPLLYIQQYGVSPGSLEISGVISGSSGVNYLGPQLCKFSGANIYTGLTDVQGGTLILANPSGACLQGDLQIDSGAAVLFNFANQLGPSSNLTVNGSGQFNFNSTNQSCNSLTLSGSIFDTLSQTLTIGSASPINLQSAQLFGHFILSSGGTISVNNTAGTDSFIAGATIQPTGPVTLDVASVNAFDLFTISTTITSGPVNKTGAGTWVVVGGSFPATNISQGTLSINSLGSPTFASILINPGGTLSIPQSESLTATTITNNGLLSLTSQQDFGIYNITGSYVQGATGNLNLNISNTHVSAVDKLLFSSTASLNGTLTVNLDTEDIVLDQDTVVFLNAVGGVSGTFSNTSSNFPSGLSFDVGYTANTAFLIFHGNHIPSFNFLQSSGYMNFAQPIFALNDEHNLQMVRRCAFVRSRFESPPKIANNHIGLLASASDKVPTKKKEQIAVSHFRNNPEGKPLSFYVAPLGSRGHFSHTHQQKGFHYRMTGGLIGTDYAFTQAGIGAQIGYEHLHAGVHDHWGRFDINNLFGRFYGTFQPLTHAPFFIDASIGSGGQWYDVDRFTTKGTAHGKPHGWEWDAYLGLGYDGWVNNVRFTPLFAVQAIETYIRKYSEHGATTHNLLFNRHHTTSLRSDLGLSIGGKLIRRKITWLPEVRGYWQHEYLGHHKHLTVATTLASLTSQTIVSGLDKNYGIIGTEQRFLFNDKWSVSLDYDYQWSRHQESNDFLVELSIYF